MGCRDPWAGPAAQGLLGESRVQTRGAPAQPLHPWGLIIESLLGCCSPFSQWVVSDSATPWTAARQASLSFAVSQSLLNLPYCQQALKHRPGHKWLRTQQFGLEHFQSLFLGKFHRYNLEITTFFPLNMYPPEKWNISCHISKDVTVISDCSPPV